MRGKRSKQYRKLMQQYGLTFGFREPYQVLVDAGMVQDAARFKMDLVHGLERTLHGKVKPMITQCSMRHLYTAEPKDPQLIDQAKTYERRRCNHHELENPLTTLECLSEVVDPKKSRTNKHRYVVASQDNEVRAAMRNIPGVPLVYINRSVMIMEPMAGATEEVREREEKDKFRVGLKSKRATGASLKRKREEGDDNAGVVDGGMSAMNGNGIATTAEPKKKHRGTKGPNPLSVKKPKKRSQEQEQEERAAKSSKKQNSPRPEAEPVGETASGEAGPEAPSKRKRKRKHKPSKEDDTQAIIGEAAAQVETLS